MAEHLSFIPGTIALLENFPPSQYVDTFAVVSAPQRIPAPVFPSGLYFSDGVTWRGLEGVTLNIATGGGGQDGLLSVNNSFIDVEVQPGDTLVGEWDSVVLYSQINLIINITGQGILQMQQSSDGVIIDLDDDRQDVLPGHPPRDLPALSGFYRTVYTNTGLEVDTVRIAVKYHISQSKDLTTFPDVLPTKNTSLKNVQAIMLGQNLDGLTYGNLQIGPSGGLLQEPLTVWGMEIALGNIPNVSGRRKFGKIYLIGPSDGIRDMWSDPNQGAMTWFDSNQTLTIESDQAVDVGTVKIVYLFDNGQLFEEASIIVNLTGTTPVPLPDGIFIYRVAPLSDPLVGDLSVFANTTTLLAYVRAVAGITQQSHYYVPELTESGMLVRGAQIPYGTISVFRASGSGSKIGEIIGHFRFPGSQIFETVNYGASTFSGSRTISPFASEIVPPKSHIWFGMSAESSATAGFIEYELIIRGFPPGQ